MKVVINKCFGGFSISRAAAEFMAARGNKRAQKELEQCDLKKDGSKRKHSTRFHGYGYVEGMEGSYDRSDPDLVAAVETLGEKANGAYAKLKVVEVDDRIDYEIVDYDGQESIHEKHRIWK